MRLHAWWRTSGGVIGVSLEGQDGTHTHVRTPSLPLSTSWRQPGLFPVRAAQWMIIVTQDHRPKECRVLTISIGRIKVLASSEICNGFRNDVVRGRSYLARHQRSYLRWVTEHVRCCGCRNCYVSQRKSVTKCRGPLLPMATLANSLFGLILVSSLTPLIV